MPLRQSGSTTRVRDENFGRSKTGTHLSTNIYIGVSSLNGFSIVGAVQRLQVSETRGIKRIPEVGTDGFIDSAPSSSTQIDGSCDRVRFQGVRIAQAFRRGFVHVHAQREPFDIQIFDVIEGAGENIILTEIQNVWIKSIQYTYNAEDFVIVDQMTWEAEAIKSSRINKSDDAVVPADDRVTLNDFEREADRGFGDYRGALDAAGLLNAFDGSGI